MVPIKMHREANLTLPQKCQTSCTPIILTTLEKKSKRKVQGVPQSQTAALPRPQQEEETDKSKQAQTEQTYEEHYD